MGEGTGRWGKEGKGGKGKGLDVPSLRRGRSGGPGEGLPGYLNSVGPRPDPHREGGRRRGEGRGEGGWRRSLGP